MYFFLISFIFYYHVFIWNKGDKQKEDDDKSDSDKEEVIQYKLEIPEHFKLPVSFLEQSNEVRDEIINDLELINTIDDTCEPIYKSTFTPVTEAGEIVLREFPKLYTSDTHYLKDTQNLLKIITLKLKKIMMR